MPIHYSISPELHMVIYVCRGVITAPEVFATADLIFVDKRCQPSLITIIDLLSAIEDFYLEDLYETIRQIERSADAGFMPGPIVLLSRSQGIHLWADALNLLQGRVPFQIGAFDTMEDAISSLGLVELHKEIMRFWLESYCLCEDF